MNRPKLFDGREYLKICYSLAYPSPIKHLQKPDENHCQKCGNRLGDLDQILCFLCSLPDHRPKRKERTRKKRLKRLDAL